MIPKRILICPQEFKGSLTANDVSNAIAKGVNSVIPAVDLIIQPLADGGPGTVDIVGKSAGGRFVTQTVMGPFGQSVEARYAIIKNATGSSAIIEQASVTALADVAPDQLNPTKATSYGVGQIILDAIEQGVNEIILGVGGTCTNDGGAGAAQALGLGLLDSAGVELPNQPLHLVRLEKITPSLNKKLNQIKLRIAVDVLNLLLGPTGATSVFGPQKGMRDWQAPALEEVLAIFANQIGIDLNIDVAERDGTGAGGGLPCGLIAAIPETTIESGASLVSDAVHLEAQMSGMDLVITGEGSLDSQTSYGKAVSHVLALAKNANIPCIAIAGQVTAMPKFLQDAEPLVSQSATDDDIEHAMTYASDRVTIATKTLIKRYCEL
jgi:glycerate kinase